MSTSTTDRERPEPEAPDWYSDRDWEHRDDAHTVRFDQTTHPAREDGSDE